MAPPPVHALLGRVEHVSYTNPSLVTNLVCRVLFGILANLACWVPLRLLYRNGEFAAVVLIVTVMLLNVLTIANAIVFPDDNVAAWPSGSGWCDFNNYFANPLLLVYTGCILAIMRNLALQLGSLRANALSGGEKRRRNLVQALIIFPIPIIQLALIYPLSAQRYAVATLIGCTWITDKSWPFIVFFVIPAPLLAIVTAYYAVLTYIRFREVQKTTATALSSNQLAAARAQRASRRLFLMTLAILIPYLPLTFVYCVVNINDSLPLVDYDFARVHNPETWGVVPLITSDQLDFAFMNANYIPILTAIPIFWFFGMTKDAINVYRSYLVKIGLGRVFPKLKDEYDPDSHLYGSGTSESFDQATIMLRQNTLQTESSVAEKGLDQSAQSTFSKFMWTVFGFGRRKSDFDNLSGHEIGSFVSHRPSMFNRLGSTTRLLNGIVHKSARRGAEAVAGVGGEDSVGTGRGQPPHSIPATGTSSTFVGKDAAADTSSVTSGGPGTGASGGWSTPPSRTGIQTRVWSGEDGRRSNDGDDGAASRLERTVMVTKHIATSTDAAVDGRSGRADDEWRREGGLATEATE